MLMSARSASGALPAAVQSDQETGSSLLKSVVPGVQHFHPSAVKFWGNAGVAGTTSADYNLSSVSDGGIGRLTPVIATDFSSAAWAPWAISQDASTGNGGGHWMDINTIAAGQFELISRNTLAAGTTALDDATRYGFGGLGDI